MSIHRRRKKLWCGVALIILAVLSTAGLVMFYWGEPRDGAGLLGSALPDEIAYRESAPQSDADAISSQRALPSSPDDTAALNSAVHSNDMTPLAAASLDKTMILAANTDELLASATNFNDGETTPLSARSDEPNASISAPISPPSIGLISGDSAIGPIAGPTAAPAPVPFTLATIALPPNNSSASPPGPASQPAHLSPSASVPSAGSPQTVSRAPSPSGPPASPTNGGVLSPSGAAPPGPVLTSTPPPTNGSPSPISAVAGSTPSSPVTPISSTPGGAAVLPIASAGATGNSWQFFDPPVAIGFNYALQPNAVGTALSFGIADIMVTTRVGAGVYDLWLYDVQTDEWVSSSEFTVNHAPIVIAADPSADPSGAFNVLDFLLGLTQQQDQMLGVTNPDLGLAQFSLRGIDPSADLNPDDPDAFITGLLFAGSINGDLLITPLAVDSATGDPVDPPSFEESIPEPSSIALFLTAFATMFWLGWVKRKAAH